MKDSFLLPGERIDDLQVPLSNGESLRVLQNPDYFCFGVDAVLLASFARVGNGERAADLGCGCGVIPLLLAAKTGAVHITGVELQPEVADMAARSVEMNGLGGRITIECADLRSFAPPERYDVITCNPPYKETRRGLISPNPYVAAARHEIFCAIDDVTAAAARMLRRGGRLCLIHRPERLVDVMCAMRASGLEPKRMRLVHPSAGKAATMVLLEGTRNGNPGLRTDPPLYIYGTNGEYSREINEIYLRT